MDKTRHLRSKSSKRKAKKDKHEPEVFVLPPDLLKKLGISIGDSSQQSAEAYESRIQNGTSETSTSNISTLSDHSSYESSFLETAILMKKSVFLSPTFVSTGANVNTGEIEIIEGCYSGKANSKLDDSIQEIQINAVDNTDTRPNDVINVDMGVDGVENVKIITSALNNAAQVIPNDCSNLTLPLKNEVSSDSSLNIIEPNENINMPLTIGETTSLTVCTNISNNLSDNTQDSKVIDSKDICPEFVQAPSLKKSNKINIISEEIIPLSKLKSLKHSVPNLTAVTVDTFITTKNVSHVTSLTNTSTNIDNNKLDLQNVDIHVEVPTYIGDGERELNSKGVTNIKSPAEAEVKLVDTITPVDNVNCDSLNINNNILTMNGCQSVNQKEIFDNSTKIFDRDKGADEFVFNVELETFDASIESAPNFKQMSDSFSEINTYISESCIQHKNHVNIDTSSVINSEDNQEMADDKNNSNNILAIQENQRSKDNNLQNISVNDTILNKSVDAMENNHLEKVKQLSAYIQQLYKSKKKSNKNKKSKKVKNDKIEKSKSKLNSNKTKSKIYIEGVEKPGGNLNKKDLDHSKVLKTYNRQKCNNKKCIVLNISLETPPSLASIEQIDTNNVKDSTLIQNYCLCYDFGRLALYDDDNVYEHIHFWRHNGTICEKEVIFSIYNEVKPATEIELNYDSNNKEHSEDDVSKICWNNDAMFNDDPCIIKNVGTASKAATTHLEEEKTDTNIDTDEVEDVIVNNEINNESQSDILVKFSSEINSDCTDCISFLNNEQKSAEMEEVIKAPVHNNIDSAIIVKDVTEDTDPDKVKTMTTIEKHSPNSNEKKKQKNQGNIEKEKPNTVVHQMCSPSFDYLIPRAKNIVTQLKRVPSRPQSLDVIEDGPPPKKNIRCGVCDKLFTNTDWTEHVINDHFHVAWKAGESLDIDSPEFVKEIRNRLKLGLYLICSICNKMQTRHIHIFLAHLRKCLLTLEEFEEIPTKSKVRKSINNSSSYQCGVCRQDVLVSDWNWHIGKEHNYLAWMNGTTPLDVNNESAVKDHLTRVSRGSTGLTCFKCGLTRKRAQVYLDHIKTCNGEKIVDSSFVDLVITEATGEDNPVICGVCNESVTIANWKTHLGKEHQYMAWEMGSEPLELDDTEAVHNHLLDIIRNSEGLKCYKCGIVRRRVKLFLTHIETCDGKGVDIEDDSVDISVNTSVDLDSTLKESKSGRTSSAKVILCGVCNKNMPESDWIEHIGTTHDYQAWREGDPPLNKDDKYMVLRHLREILQKSKHLKCNKCGFQLKKAVLYLSHIAKCMNVNLEAEESKLVTCGVCKEEMVITKWMEHIKTEHNYIAWQEGSTPVDLNDECAVRAHLNNMSREFDGLICKICGVAKKYPKLYLDHMEECHSQEISNTTDNFAVALDAKIVTCGVCKKEIETNTWFEHIKKKHNYIAWVEGQEVIDEKDPDIVYKHLIGVSKLGGGLSCLKCGAKRKVVKAYMQHVETCGVQLSANDADSNDMVICAVCEEKLCPKDWRSHAMNRHYNVAWIVGDYPIEINSPYVVEPYIKEYLRVKKKLVCRLCGVSRVSNVGFYAHVIQCGKTEEEMDIYKEKCDICKGKYLKIYKSQHMTAHKEKEYAMERRLLLAKEKKTKIEELEARQKADLNVSGSRRAAEKAKSVIEKYRKGNKAGEYNCDKCKFNTDVESELNDHVCVKKYSEGESDESVDLEHCSSDLGSGDSDIDSDVSEQERQRSDCEGKRRSNDHGSASKVQRLPYKVQNVSAYIKECAEEFRSTHLTDEDLFPQWRNLDSEILSENELSKYTPPIEKSCQVKFRNSGWNTLDRFESRREDTKQGYVTVSFAGAYIECMSWLPPHVAKVEESQYVAVACHLAADAPRHSAHETIHSPAIIQIWDCQVKLTSMEFVLGIALDFGAVWAMDWCPSGARDIFDCSQKDSKQFRLGLLAIACSNGSAYILSIPYPTKCDDKNKAYCRLKPVAELRFQMSSNKKKYQASAVKWSPGKGHSNIVVGYSDGTVAYYDVTGESPLLKSVEDGVIIFYPYNEERPLNASIEEVDMYASASGGAVCAGSASGAGAWARGCLVPAHVPARRARFAPHWPAALLAGDDALVWQTVNEVEWWGGGRRLGGARTYACCAWCARVCYSTPPLLRVTRLHPANEEFIKMAVATLEMLPLVESRKREERENDELSMVVEPFTYEEAIQKYGIVFNQITSKDKTSQRRCTTLPKEVYPHRFPLNDVADLLFCPNAAHHNKLLIGLRSGHMIVMSL